MESSPVVMSPANDSARLIPTAPPLSQDTQEGEDASGFRSASDVLEKLSVTSDYDEFSDIFSSNLMKVFEYDQTEIIDFLSERTHTRDKLISLRQKMFDTLVTTKTELSSAAMYNRKKIKLIAEDIYILGYSVVNKASDKRLSKVLKLPQQSSTDSQDVSFIAPLLDPVDITETCIVLRDTVTDLTRVISELTTEVKSLKCKVSQLEVQVDLMIRPAPHRAWTLLDLPLLQMT